MLDGQVRCKRSIKLENEKFVEFLIIDGRATTLPQLRDA